MKKITMVIVFINGKLNLSSFCFKTCTCEKHIDIITIFKFLYIRELSKLRYE